MKKCAVLMLLLTGLTFSSSAITLEELAGTYEGWRTQTIDGQTTRYSEVDTIYPDGTIVQEVTTEEGFVSTLITVLAIDEAGAFSDAYSSGQLTLRGSHLDVQVHFYLTPLGTEADVHFSANRTLKLNPSANKRWSAVYLSQLAGVYRGWRTQTIGSEMTRFPETDTILPDGTIIQEVTLPDGTITTAVAMLNLDELEKFGDIYTRGLLRLQGKHLDVHVHFVQTDFSPQADVHFSGNRVPSLNP